MSLIKSISGIRGTIGGKAGEGLNPLDIVKFTAAYATLIRKTTSVNTNKIVVGRDARISGEMVNYCVVGTLMGMGFDVVNIGLATTPTTELAVTMENACGGIILTASHNPKQWNALKLLNEKGAESSIEDRKWFAKEAFAVSSGYDTAIFNYFDNGEGSYFRCAENDAKVLRYGENPHQKGLFFGKFGEMFEQLHGKEISYNNLLDIDAAVSLIAEFDELTFAILKHNNACGLASRPVLVDAWKAALAGDPVSAFGGVLITNGKIDKATAEEMNNLFFEVVIAPGYDADALEILEQKKNRIILVLKENKTKSLQFRSLLNGVLMQERDLHCEKPEELTQVTKKSVTPEEVEDLLFANKIVKHSKSNAIVLAKGKQLYASGVGQTSRVDSLRHAIEKAKSFDFDLKGCVMASDAFFPFPDCVEIAHKEGIDTVIQPGGSVRDNQTIDYCNENGVAMVTTGIRHFKH